MSFPDYIVKNSQYTFPSGVINPPTSSCYSSLAAYGVHGAVSNIKAPTPVSVVPMILNKLGNGHKKMSRTHHTHHGTHRTHHVTNRPSHNCTPYLTVNQQCTKSEFNQMFDDRRHLK